jgi:beta-galactosidase
MPTRETLLLDPGWLFHLGDIDSPLSNKHIAAYMNNKAGWARGAARGNFDDSDWRSVDLPHDWSVEGKFDPENHVDAGFLPRGIAWYRRHFTLDESDRGKHLSITFDGVATHCTVYVNGHLVHRNFCGYTPFTIDITDIANFGPMLNTIAVRVDATYMEGWWYEGAGIYRHVGLKKTSKLHVAGDGVFVNPYRTNDNNWSTQIQTSIENTSDEAARCEIFSTIKNAHGSAVGQTTTKIELAARSTLVVHQAILVSNPSLWSCDAPTLYALQIQVRADDTLLDEASTTFGYRTIRFDPNDGFFLNEKPLKLLGVCNHQDHAGVGVALPDSIHEFRIRRLKEMGCNAYRCAHNPPARELLDACDRLGMLVMDETRNFGSAPEHLSQLREIVKRDRNHPSVILWSICNEEAIQGTPVSANIARTMLEAVKELDPSRPVTAAVSGGILNDDCIATAIEVTGINYQLPVHDQYHAKHPRIPLYAAETHCVLSTRGVYETKEFYFASDDSQHERWGETARQTWRFIKSRPFIAGLFIWTGFDYRGEPSPHAWPCVNSHFGLLDMCGFAKDSFYLHKTFFTSEPFVHLLPHWNWTAREGLSIRVLAYSNCDEVELLLNGESLGRRPIDPIEMAQWQVVYQPGILKALAFRQGQLVTQSTIETTSEPIALGLEIHESFDASTIPADGRFAVPITVFAVDEHGRRVPTASNFVRFDLTGHGKILGVGNGDPTCHEPDQACSRSLFNGMAQVIVQTTATPGEISLTATADGLKPATLRINSTQASIKPAVAVAVLRHLITDWRMSSIVADRPDVHQQIADSDMNSWERIDPSAGPQKAWTTKSGFAIYRATANVPKILQSTGGRVVFSKLAGSAEVYLNNQRVADAFNAEFPPSVQKLSLVVLIHATSPDAGIIGPIELAKPRQPVVS